MAIRASEFEKLARTHVCGECGGMLLTRWDSEAGSVVLRCSKDASHEKLRRIPSRTEAWKRGDPTPIHIADKLEKKIGGKPMASKALVAQDMKQMLARIDQAKFPQDMTVADKRLLAEVALTYGFDPLMGELVIYQGRPFVSIDGRYRKAQETGELDGVESRPATKTEREAWSIPDGDYFFRAEVRRKGAAFPFVGWGRVKVGETIGGKGYKPVETNPQRMAEKRAEAQALRKAFTIPLPNVEEIGAEEGMSTADYIDSTGRTLPEEAMPAAGILPASPHPASAKAANGAGQPPVKAYCPTHADDNGGAIPMKQNPATGKWEHPLGSGTCVWDTPAFF